MKRRILLSLFAIGLALTGCDDDPGQPIAKTPDFILTDTEGKSFQLSSTQGKVVLLHFFATDCPICIAQAEEMKALYQTFVDNPNVLLIGIAVGSDGADDVMDFVSENNIPYRVLIDDNLVSQAYLISTTPATVYIRRNGVIEGRTVGEVSHDALEAVVVDLLN